MLYFQLFLMPFVLSRHVDVLTAAMAFVRFYLVHWCNTYVRRWTKSDAKPIKVQTQLKWYVYIIRRLRRNAENEYRHRFIYVTPIRNSSSDGTRMHSRNSFIEQQSRAVTTIIRMTKYPQIPQILVEQFIFVFFCLYSQLPLTQWICFQSIQIFKIFSHFLLVIFNVWGTFCAKLQRALVQHQNFTFYTHWRWRSVIAIETNYWKLSFAFFIWWRQMYDFSQSLVFPSSIRGLRCEWMRKNSQILRCERHSQHRAHTNVQSIPYLLFASRTHIRTECHRMRQH